MGTLKGEDKDQACVQGTPEPTQPRTCRTSWWLDPRGWGGQTLPGGGPRMALGKAQAGQSPPALGLQRPEPLAGTKGQGDNTVRRAWVGTHRVFSDKVPSSALCLGHLIYKRGVTGAPLPRWNERPHEGLAWGWYPGTTARHPCLPPAVIRRGDPGPHCRCGGAGPSRLALLVGKQPRHCPFHACW